MFTAHGSYLLMTGNPAARREAPGRSGDGVGHQGPAGCGPPRTSRYREAAGSRPVALRLCAPPNFEQPVIGRRMPIRESQGRVAQRQRSSLWTGRDRRLDAGLPGAAWREEPLPGDPGLTYKGREQATCTGRWLRSQGVRAVSSSPLRRARETAECIGSVCGLAVQPGARLGESLNWDGSQPFDAFLALWARTAQDRKRPAAHSLW
jgi:hypothetical protein